MSPSEIFDHKYLHVWLWIILYFTWSHALTPAIILFWQANIIDSIESPCANKKGNVDADKMAVLNAWRRVDSRTREALRRSVVSELIEGYEVNLFLYSLTLAGLLYSLFDFPHIHFHLSLNWIVTQLESFIVILIRKFIFHFQERIRGYLTESREEDADSLILRVQDPFRRLLLHGICEVKNHIFQIIMDSIKGIV